MWNSVTRVGVVSRLYLVAVYVRYNDCYTVYCCYSLESNIVRTVNHVYLNYLQARSLRSGLRNTAA